MIERKTTITVDGVEYRAELARVAGTHLGFEDHGILSVNVDFEGLGGGWGQGTGHHFTDRPHRMFLWVHALIAFFGGRWETIPGQECFILRDGHSGPIVGLASKSDDGCLLFGALRAEVEAEELDVIEARCAKSTEH